jgi:EAL domain-containing protein (putative c-di-GMP-specific phosphodiesterase class I)
MNDIAHAMGKYTIAEFVDNADVMRILKEINIDLIQGYHIGGPVLIENNMLFETKAKIIRLM